MWEASRHVRKGLCPCSAPRRAWLDGYEPGLILSVPEIVSLISLDPDANLDGDRLRSRFAAGLRP